MEKTYKNNFFFYARLLAVFAGLYLAKLYSYVLFHNLAEMFSIVIAGSIFVLSWNSRHYSDNNYFLFIGIAFLYIAAVDLIHTLAYKGMGVFPGYDANLPTQLWIGARYIQSLSFLVAPFFLNRKLKTHYVFIVYTAVLITLFLSLFSWHNFPACFIEGAGLTPFKVFSEYFISFILIASAIFLLKKKKEFDKQVLGLLIASILTTIVSEMSFTLYKDVYGFFNAFGHFLKIVAFFFIYKAIIQTGLERPFSILFKNLKRQQEELEIILDSVPALIFYKDKENRFIRVNKVLAEIMGISKEQFEGKPLSDLYPKDRAEAYWKADKEVIASGKPVTNIIESTETKQGIRWVQTDKVPYRDAQGNIIGIIGFSIDITDRKRVEEELFKARKLESIGILAGGIAHDFNNILTSIIGNISMAKMRAKSEHKIYDLLNAAETASMKARRLTGQLLTFAKGGTPVKEISSISNILKESSAVVLRDSKLECKFQIAEDLWPVEADPGQISQVIYNIVANSSQAMPEGGIILITAENLLPEKINDIPVSPGRYIHISIKDHGVGIAEKNLSNIFDPYFTTKKEGSGIGLAVAYSIIKKHYGHISVDSSLGVGTTFHIYLPASGKEIPLKEEPTLLTGAGKILVMDDDEFLREMMGEMLNMLGYEADFAENGAEAIELFNKARESGKPHDAVVLDLTIPGSMGGKDVIKILLGIDPEIKAIVFSGYSDDPVMSNFREYGFKGMMPKPFDSNALGKVLNDVLIGR